MPDTKTRPLPDTSDAEDWKDEETFVVKGREYKLTPGLEVVPTEGSGK